MLLSKAPLPGGAFALYKRGATTNGAGRFLLGIAERHSYRPVVPPHRDPLGRVGEVELSTGLRRDSSPATVVWVSPPVSPNIRVTVRADSQFESALMFEWRVSEGE